MLRSKCSVWVRIAAAGQRGKRVVRRMVRSEQGLAWNETQARIGGSERVGLAERERNKGHALLVALHTTDLPATENLVGDAALVDELLALANWQLIEIAEHEHMRDVLITERFLRFQVTGILRVEGIRTTEGRQAGVGAVGVGQSLRESVRSNQVQAVAKAAFEFGLQGVIGGLPEILKAAIGGDAVGLKLGEG